MKVKVLLLAVLLGIVPSHTAEGRPSVDPLSRSKPLLLRLGEEFSFWLGGGGTAPDPSSSSSSSTVNRALLQLSQHLLQARAEQEEQQLEEDSEEKEKRSDEHSLSLDLTFHLLREVLEMARAEKMVQQADNNRRMMEAFGK